MNTRIEMSWSRCFACFTVLVCYDFDWYVVDVLIRHIFFEIESNETVSTDAYAYVSLCIDDLRVMNNECGRIDAFASQSIDISFETIRQFSSNDECATHDEFSLRLRRVKSETWTDRQKASTSSTRLSSKIDIVYPMIRSIEINSLSHKKWTIDLNENRCTLFDCILSTSYRSNDKH
jgi:hypothetical protein